jgi:hypothetical protein
MSVSLSVIPFGELISGASVRVALIGGVQYLSVRDLIMVMCGQTYIHASKTWSRMSETFKDEVSTDCRHLKFKGTGQKEQAVIQFRGAIKLMMQLPGEQAKQFRSQASAILTRYYAGDKTLLADVIANAESGAGINEAARDALPDVVDEMGTKRRRIVTTISEKELVRMKEQNVFLREHIDLKREFYGVELSYERDKLAMVGQGRAQELQHESTKLQHESTKLQHESTKIDLIDKERKSEVEYKKALKAMESGPAKISPTRPVQAASTGPVQATPIRPVQAASTGPAKISPTRPVQAASTGPVQATPIRPVQAASTGPVQVIWTGPVQATPMPPVQVTSTQPVEGSSSPPAGFTTALHVFEKHVHEFLWIDPSYKGTFFLDVGKKVAEAYQKAGGTLPSTAVYDCYGLTQYPIVWENTILEALRAVRIYIDFVGICENNM